MEIKSTIRPYRLLVRFIVYMGIVLLSFPPLKLAAQDLLKKYTVRGGKMYIELSKHLRESALDSFIAQYDLFDLDLKQFLRTNKPDSLRKLGWAIEMSNEAGCIISKPLMAVQSVNNPAEKILFTSKNPSFAEMFPAVNNGVRYGYNQFRNQFPFTVRDSVVTFFLRNNKKAREVMLAGSFNNWQFGAMKMILTDSGWIGRVKLGKGKYWYKFIVDGRWITDPANQVSENDGLGNVNSVFFKTNTLFRFTGAPNAKRVYLAGSFNNWRPRELQMIKTASGWELPLYLPQGTHTYKFVADGNWYADDKNAAGLPDEFGNYNSLILIGKPHLFRLNGYTNAKKVVLSGSFNGWREDELFMMKTPTGWELPYVLGPGNYEYKFIADGKWLTDLVNPLTAAGTTGNSFLIIEPNYTFRLKGFSNAKAVFLAGDFNSWSPSAFPMKKQGDEWVFTVNLSIGKHLYKYIVDGNWILDPTNKLWEQNEERTGNSIIWVGP